MSFVTCFIWMTSNTFKIHFELFPNLFSSCVDQTASEDSTQAAVCVLRVMSNLLVSVTLPEKYIFRQHAFVLFKILYLFISDKINHSDMSWTFFCESAHTHTHTH